MSKSLEKSVTLIYCPYHAGIRGNERGDSLAVKVVTGSIVMIRDRPATIRAVEVTFQHVE